MDDDEEKPCPITQSDFSQIEVPVYVPGVDGKRGYWAEYAAITRWLESNNTCPLSRRTLEVHELRRNRDIIFLLDKSHSMTRPAVSEHMKKTLSSEKVHAAESMRTLDLSAYMLLFILKSLPKFCCTFSVLVFCKSYRVLCKRQLLTKHSIQLCEDALRFMSPGLTTNWQDPILASLEEVRISQQSKKIHTAILMITDGEPTEKSDTTLETVGNAVQSITSNLSFAAFIYGDEANSGLNILHNIVQCLNKSKGAGGLYFLPSPLEMFDLKTSVPIQWLHNYHSSILSPAVSNQFGDHDTEPTLKYIKLLSQVIDICVPKQTYSACQVSRQDVAIAKAIIDSYRPSAVIYDQCLDEALDFINTWGLPAVYVLRCQHILGYCANTFDNSTQIYKADDDELRKALQNELQKFFVSGRLCGTANAMSNLGHSNHSDAQSPSHQYHTVTSQHYQTHAPVQAPVQRALSQIYVADGGCVTGDTVFSSREGPICVTQLIANNGGQLMTNHGSYATIEFIICREIAREKKVLILNETPNLRITEWHPVIPHHGNLTFASHWIFSNDCIYVTLNDNEKLGSSEDTQLVYSIIFKEENGVRPSMIWTPSHYVAAAGHGLTCPKKYPIIGHPYWGSGILSDIKCTPGSVCVMMN